MLKHPMQERFHKMVKILDIDSKTFINFLDYLKSGVFKEESLSGVFNLYRFGDKYIIKDLMRICADKMVPFFSLKSTDALEMMANMHSDEYLLQLVESFKNKSMNSDASHPKTDEASNVYRNHFEENKSERYRNTLTMKIALACPFYRCPRFQEEDNATDIQFFQNADPTAGISIKSHLYKVGLGSAVHAYAKSFEIHFNNKKTELD
ncbi:hypothetical protein TNIN_316611 [Trichonephila inaurata madagascariensis]|uniref:BTB domain-containing protein n=1 Tax=Trichonephila inaurata madagascariensis TaxID=2747483 RepID=A0A8X6YWZ7_9ARAC|nr:hypothetical protein TNIN_316611 [Trichonephila inaurata madagascariensis]